MLMTPIGYQPESDDNTNWMVTFLTVPVGITKLIENVIKSILNLKQ